MALLCFTARVGQTKQPRSDAVLVHFGEGEVDGVDFFACFFGNVFEHVASGHCKIVRTLVLDPALQVLVDGLLVAERKSDHQIDCADVSFVSHWCPQCLMCGSVKHIKIPLPEIIGIASIAHRFVTLTHRFLTRRVFGEDPELIVADRVRHSIGNFF